MIYNTSVSARFDDSTNLQMFTAPSCPFLVKRMRVKANFCTTLNATRGSDVVGCFDVVAVQWGPLVIGQVMPNNTSEFLIEFPTPRNINGAPLTIELRTPVDSASTTVQYVPVLVAIAGVSYVTINFEFHSE